MRYSALSLACALCVFLASSLDTGAAHAALWGGVGRELTLREKWQQEFLSSDLIVLARVLAVRDAVDDTVRTARAEAIAHQRSPALPIDLSLQKIVVTLAPVHRVMGGPFLAPFETVFSFSNFWGLPDIAALQRTVGRDSLAVFAFLKHDLGEWRYDEQHYVFPAGYVTVDERDWNSQMDSARVWAAQLSLDSLVARADVVDELDSIATGGHDPNGQGGRLVSMRLRRVLKGDVGSTVSARLFPQGRLADHPRYVYLRRVEFAIYEPMPMSWGYLGVFAPADSDSSALLEAIKRQRARGAPGRARQHD